MRLPMALIATTCLILASMTFAQDGFESLSDSGSDPETTPLDESSLSTSRTPPPPYELRAVDPDPGSGFRSSPDDVIRLGSGGSNAARARRRRSGNSDESSSGSGFGGFGLGGGAGRVNNDDDRGGGLFDRGSRRNQQEDHFTQKLRKAEEDAQILARHLKQVPAEKRADVARQLDEALQNLFDVRTEMRETQIADLEKRIQTLRTQLQERVEKKTDIIQLRLQTLVNEANGLTF